MFEELKIDMAAGGPVKVTAYRGEHGVALNSLLTPSINTRLPEISFGSINAALIYATSPNNRTSIQNGDSRILECEIQIENPFLRSEDPMIEINQLLGVMDASAVFTFAKGFEDSIKNSTLYYDYAGKNPSLSFDELLKLDISTEGLLFFEAYRAFGDPAFVSYIQKFGFDGAIHGGSDSTARELEVKTFCPENVRIKNIFTLEEVQRQLESSQPTTTRKQQYKMM